MTLPKTSFAMVQTAPRKLEPMDLPLPEIDADSGLLRIEACGICGSDYEQYEGQLRTPMPVVPGHEPLGVVAAIGDRAAQRWGVDVGDRIAVETMIACRHCDKLALARTFVGALFLGAVSDAMLLGHWYLVQPGLARAPIVELVRWTAILWPFELLVLLWPTGMLSVLSGTIDDGYGGMLGWYWVASTVATILLVGATRAALRERQYSAVMAATGLLYLAILTAFGMDLVARATLA